LDGIERINMDRFDIEQAIMAVWSTDQDIDALLWRMEDSPNGPLSEDDLANYLLAIKHTLNLRCERLFDVYCKTATFKEVNNERLPTRV
jgi:hypothetical protein